MWKKFRGLDNLWYGESVMNMSCFQYKSFYWKKRSCSMWFLSYSTLIVLFLLMHIGHFWTNHMHCWLVFSHFFFSVLLQSCMCSISQKAQVSCFHTVHKTLAMIQTESSQKFGIRIEDILNGDRVVIMRTYISARNCCQMERIFIPAQFLC